MANPRGGSESIQLDGGTLGHLSFDWSHDRYQHRWSFPKSALKIISVESESTELWPLSPPLQQIHCQSFGDGREVIFGVGMAGRGHWSASFTLVPDLNCWIVEFACRCPVTPERLSSCYQINNLSSANVLTADENAFFLCRDQQIRMEAIAPGTVTGQLEASLDSQQIHFSPYQLPKDTETIQWAFRLRAG